MCCCLKSIRDGLKDCLTVELSQEIPVHTGRSPVSSVHHEGVNGRATKSRIKNYAIATAVVGGVTLLVALAAASVIGIPVVAGLAAGTIAASLALPTLVTAGLISAFSFGLMGLLISARSEVKGH